MEYGDSTYGFLKQHRLLPEGLPLFLCQVGKGKSLRGSACVE